MCVVKLADGTGTGTMLMDVRLFKTASLLVYDMKASTFSCTVSVSFISSTCSVSLCISGPPCCKTAVSFLILSCNVLLVARQQCQIIVKTQLCCLSGVRITLFSLFVIGHEQEEPNRYICVI